MSSPLDAYFKSNNLERVSSEEAEVKQEETVETPVTEEVSSEATEEVVEDKTVETTTETEAEVEKQAEVEPEKEVVEQVSFEDTFKEKYGSLEELENKIRSLEEKKGFESQFAEEDLSRLSSLLDGGLSWDKIGEIARIQTLDVESLTDEQAFAKALELRDGLSEAEVKYKLYEFKKLDDVDFDLLDEEEKAAHLAKKAEYARLASQGKEFLKGLKSDEKYTLPTPKAKQEEANQEELIKQQQAEFEELQKLYEKGVDSTISGINSIKVNLGEDKDFEFELDDEMKQEVRKEMFDVNNYYKQFEGDKDNPVLFDKMFDLTAKRLFFDKVLQSAVESVINDGTVNAVKDINNVVDKSNKQPSNQKPDVQKQVLDGWKRANGLL